MPIHIIFAAALVLPLLAAQAQAHKRWLMPTDFSLSEAETITVDFSASNNLFFVDKSMPLAGVTVLAPQGETMPLVNPTEGARRSSFDVNVAQPGTYRIYDRGQPVFFVSYRLPSEAQPVRKRGQWAALQAAVPAAANDVKFARSQALIETYVTLGQDSVPPPLADMDGLSLQLLSHPNTLYADEAAEFRVLLDGEAAAGAEVTVVRDGTRYRDSLDELVIESDAEGRVAIQWPASGRYLLEVEVQQHQPGQVVGTHYFGYFLTLEVLAP